LFFILFFGIVGFITIGKIEKQRLETEQKFLKSIIDTEERERLKFSQELHDGLGPILSNIQLYFEWLAEGDENKDLIVEKGSNSLKQAFQTIKEVSHKLSPGKIHRLGLIDSIKDNIEQFPLKDKIDIQFNYKWEGRLDINVEASMYRVVNELITNTVKHAGAKNIKISILKEEKSVFVNYWDNGKGLDEDSIREGCRGINNIRSRVRSLDGYVKFTSNSNNGLMVFIHIPLKSLE